MSKPYGLLLKMMPRMQNNSSKGSDVHFGSSDSRPTSKYRSLPYQLTTLFLFTKSDFKTVILPQSVFALSLVFSAPEAARLYHPNGRGEMALRIGYMLAWIWLHLLIEDVANQSIDNSIIEDSVNKPWRPIPAGRLSALEARSLLRVAVVAAMALSVFLHSLLPSTTLMTVVWLYNDLDGCSTGPIMRNALNAAGLACFGWGAVSVLLDGQLGEGNTARDWMVLTAVIVLTTVHVQDLPDMEGDRARNRQTAPLVYGEAWTRWTVAVLTCFWSVVCSAFWRVSIPYAMAPLGIAMAMSAVILLSKSQPLDEVGWKLWCLWVSVLFLLPLLRNTADQQLPGSEALLGLVL
ncbi:UbiA prenyltransferase family-domain-containing protein [Xylaria sp. CBS 124048]|nr:UbiA prenyltransferase family-domain-containing protein [Xylaria sp. CBS 124048]